MQKEKVKDKLKKKIKFKKICRDIKKVKIQGARDIARKSLEAYYLFPTKKSLKKLFSLRPTEPMMHKVLKLAKKGVSRKKILEHFDKAQEEINKKVKKIIKKDEVIFTHCHSTNVVNALVYSHKNGKRFQVYNTETRPLYQGRKTSKEISNQGIKVTSFVDSALGVALSKEQGTKKVDKVFLGCDAITKEGIINKIGSEVIAQIAKNEKIPVYIIADSWKYSPTEIPIEQRKINEVWDKAPKKVKIKNPSFEFVDKKYITKIITELGVMDFDKFLKEVKKN